jgi:hypothetical protein|tara:strand:- start:6292 stop:6723 length:432 start_codon:yes stop_codon:yes gene_type:complete
MAHFAKIDESNNVIDVLHVDDKDAATEAEGQQYLFTHNNWPANLWVQTSYNTWENQHKLGGTPFRGNYATIGGTWDSANNIFWDVQPYPSWVKDIPSASWKSPAGDQPSLNAEQEAQNAADTHGWKYEWNETDQQWDLNNTIA